jgi:hypothetical protein
MVDVGTQTDEVYIIDKTDINHPEYNPRNKAPNQIDLLIIITCEDYFNIYNLLFNDLSENYISQKFSPQHSSYKFKLLEIFNFINDPIGKFYYNDDIESEYNITHDNVPNEVEDKKVIFIHYDAKTHKIQFKTNYLLPEIFKLLVVKFMLEIEKKIDKEDILKFIE